MKRYSLKVRLRDIIGKQVRRLRKEGLIPAVLYGHKTKNKHLSVLATDFNDVYNHAGRSSLVELAIEGEEKDIVLIQQVSYHPVSDEIIHVDFRKVNMKEKIETEVPITLENEAPAEKELGGSLIQNLSVLRIEALPQDLIGEIKADVSVLKTFEDVIKVSDLTVPATIEVHEDPDTVVALVQEPRSEEELAALEEEVKEDVDAVEVETKSAESEEGEGSKDTTDEEVKEKSNEKKE